jgi:hypothetical protein
MVLGRWYFGTVGLLCSRAAKNFFLSFACFRSAVCHSVMVAIPFRKTMTVRTSKVMLPLPPDRWPPAKIRRQLYAFFVDTSITGQTKKNSRSSLSHGGVTNPVPVRPSRQLAYVLKEVCAVAV